MYNRTTKPYKVLFLISGKTCFLLPSAPNNVPAMILFPGSSLEPCKSEPIKIT